MYHGLAAPAGTKFQDPLLSLATPDKLTESVDVNTCLQRFSSGLWSSSLP
ncbi:hypothetical protein C8R31_101776 [Nitrosospira sp. Nsp2]|nr:hypothetical protein C8R31_101776 [Nitrosospira sp. Nsp2]